MESFTVTHVDVNTARTELHDALSLSGAEISINNLPAGAAVPFVHSHRHNEEIYLVLSGKGQIWVDGTVHDLASGDCFRIATGVGRAIKADDASAMRFVCIQVRENSLEGYTANDADVCTPVQGPAWLVKA